MKFCQAASGFQRVEAGLSLPVLLGPRQATGLKERHVPDKNAEIRPDRLRKVRSYRSNGRCTKPVWIGEAIAQAGSRGSIFDPRSRTAKKSRHSVVVELAAVTGAQIALGMGSFHPTQAAWLSSST